MAGLDLGAAIPKHSRQLYFYLVLIIQILAALLLKALANLFRELSVRVSLHSWL
jgi:hypothetical protein